MLLTRAPVAGGGIATSPLPLDLHVLSLSLAFILSQDQTLRCCLSSFLFFQIKNEQINHFKLFALSSADARIAVLSAATVSGTLSLLLTYLFKEIDSGHSFSMTLVLLLVYCNSFNVLRFPGVLPSKAVQSYGNFFIHANIFK